MLEDLDNLYVFEKSGSKKRAEDFIYHPLVQNIGLDEKHGLIPTERIEESPINPRT